MKQIHDRIMNNWPNTPLVTFKQIRSTLSRERRKLTPALPQMVSEIHATLSGTQYSVIQSENFYRGYVQDSNEKAFFHF